MPSGKNWFHFFYVNLAFMIYIAGVFYFNQVATIKANWPLYRCNPMYMGLADDINENFQYCIQSTQTHFMGYLLQPLTFVTNSLTSMTGGVMGDIQNVRAMFNKIRTFFSSIIESIFSVFLNLIIEFMKVTIGIKDLIGKTIGIMVSLMYVMDGSMKTMQSTWKGPPGQMVRSLGKCFSPYTVIKLKSGEYTFMKNVQLGNILEDGSIVEAVLKIDNRENEPYYSIANDTTQPIYVTGSHLIFDIDTHSFVKVSKYKHAIKTNRVGEWFSCLITNTHRIPICHQIFWDWEDHFVKK